MITLDEKDIVEETKEISEEDDVQYKVESLKQALSNGELPDDLKNFIVSMQKPSSSSLSSDLDDESDGIGDDEEVAYDVEVNEALADEDDDLLDGENVSVEDLNKMF